MSKSSKSIVSVLALTGIGLLILFSSVFLYITYQAKQRAEQIKYRFYSGIIDKHRDGIGHLFQSAEVISQGVKMNFRDLSRDERSVPETLDEYISGSLATDSAFQGMWYTDLKKKSGTNNRDSVILRGAYWHTPVNETGADVSADRAGFKPNSRIALPAMLLSDTVSRFIYTTAWEKEAVIRYVYKISGDTNYAVFGIDINLRTLISRMRSVDSSEHPYMFFISPEKQLLKIPYLAADLDSSREKGYMIDHLLKHHVGTVLYDSMIHQDVMHYHRDLFVLGNKKPWRLGMRMPLRVVSRDFVPIRNFMLLIGLFSFFLMSVLIVYAVFRWKREKDEREQAEDMLNNSYAQLLSYMEGSENINIFSIDRNYHYINFNTVHKQEMMRRFNRKPEKNRNILEILPARISKIMKGYYDRALSGEQYMLTIEYDNSYFQQIFNPIYDSENSILGFTCNLVDITDKVIAQKELEQYREQLEELVEERTKELRYQKEFFQMLIDQVPNQVFVRDKENRYVLVNKACAKAFGMSPVNMIGKTIRETLYDKDAAVTFSQEDTTILEEDIVVSYEDRVINVLGEEQWVIINKTRVKLQDEFFVLGVFVDITYLKNTENRLYEANIELSDTISKLKKTQSKLVESEKMASLGQLVGGIAHEINNPINYVSGNVTPLLKDFEDISSFLEECRKSSEEHPHLRQLVDKYDIAFLIEEMALLLEGIREGAVRIQTIINNLRTFATFDREEFIKADIISGLKSTVMLVKFHIKNRITIETNLQPLPEILCIPSKLNQVFLNLLNNAVQSIEGSGTIKVYTQVLSEREVEIAISDTGCGIPEDIRGRIFDPFFTTKEVGSGTGLGLSLSFSIVRQHQGEIMFEPNYPRGTIFKIILPVNPVSG